MTEYLTMDDLLDIAPGAIGQDVLVRDYGLLEAAVARPQASAFGQDAYPDLHVKAAALLHSLVSNHALVDGNKRLAWAACRVFLGLNDQWVSGISEDERVDFVVAVASSELSDLEKIAERLRCWTR
jgi:death-on-curing protein